MRAKTLAAAAMIASSWPAYAQESQSTPAQSIPATAAPATLPTTALSLLPVAAPSTNATSSTPTSLKKVVVSSDLDAARAEIAPSLGADTYKIGLDQIQAIPGGENASFQNVLLRAPGVVEDSFGQVHVRGEHANLTYRVNGVLLPEPLNGFGQELDTHLIQSMTLITGSLPAQFGFHTAGIVDVTTKTGASLNGSEISLYGGSFDTFKSTFQTGGTYKKLDYFFTGTYDHNNLGLENPTDSQRALHDYTDQEKLFGYLSFQIDPTSRVSLIMNASNGDFQIPNTPNVPTAFTLTGQSNTDSRKINENQNEQEYYTVLSYQKIIDDFSFQLSGFSRYGQIDFRPDPVNDLIFQGVAGEVFNSFVTNGVQFDSSYILNDQHTLRGGFVADYTAEKLDTNTAVFPVDADGNQTSSDPFSIADESDNSAWQTGFYLQDEWRIFPQLTFNYGLRYDRFDASFDDEDQVSPRANMVWKIDEPTTVHAGYARYFVPPPIQDVHASTLNKFAGTTNTPENFINNPPKVERSNYYDAGISRQLTKEWGANLDGFYKQAENLVDLGQFGAPVILSPFNYNRGTVYGAEVSSTYKQGGLSLFGNFSWVLTSANEIVSQQFLFGNDELDYIRTHNVKLDHEAEYSASGGASYNWKNDMVYSDILFGSGLRSGFANTEHVGAHWTMNVGYGHVFNLDTSGKHAIRLRFDVVNIFDQKYELRDGSGIGVGAAQFGERRGYFVGVSYAF